MSGRQHCPASNSMSLAEARESGLLDLWCPRRAKQNQTKAFNRRHKSASPMAGKHELQDSAAAKIKDGDVRVLSMPFPPSVNNYWQRSSDGGVHIGKAGRDFIETISKLVMINRWRGLVGDALCDLALMLVPPDRKTPHDCDNFCKATLDAFTKAGVWIDDVQVKSIKVVMLPPDVGGTGRAEVAERLHGGHTVTTAAQLLE
jgi:crossover junction endodeoxyribonuclease RusA